MATNERSIEVLAAQQKATEGFDYFVCGVAGAIFAYIVKDYSPQRLSLDFSLLTPTSLLLLAASFYMGLNRIENTIVCARLNARKLNASEKAESLSEILMSRQSGTPVVSLAGKPETMETVASRRDHYLAELSNLTRDFEKRRGRALLYYKLRDKFLILGFITILCAKIAQPYTRGVSAEKTISPEIKKPMQPLSPFTNLSGQTNR